jgi:hypothetical protein
LFVSTALIFNYFKKEPAKPEEVNMQEVQEPEEDQDVDGVDEGDLQVNKFLLQFINYF